LYSLLNLSISAWYGLEKIEYIVKGKNEKPEEKMNVCSKKDNYLL